MLHRCNRRFLWCHYCPPIRPWRDAGRRRWRTFAGADHGFDRIADFLPVSDSWHRVTVIVAENDERASKDVIDGMSKSMGTRWPTTSSSCFSLLSSSTHLVQSNLGVRSLRLKGAEGAARAIQECRPSVLIVGIVLLTGFVNSVCRLSQRQVGPARTDICADADDPWNFA